MEDSNNEGQKNLAETIINSQPDNRPPADITQVKPVQELDEEKKLTRREAIHKGVNSALEGAVLAVAAGNMGAVAAGFSNSREPQATQQTPEAVSPPESRQTTRRGLFGKLLSPITNILDAQGKANKAPLDAHKLMVEEQRRTGNPQLRAEREKIEKEDAQKNPTN